MWFEWPFWRDNQNGTKNNGIYLPFALIISAYLQIDLNFPFCDDISLHYTLLIGTVRLTAIEIKISGANIWFKCSILVKLLIFWVCINFFLVGKFNEPIWSRSSLILKRLTSYYYKHRQCQEALPLPAVAFLFVVVVVVINYLKKFENIFCFWMHFACFAFDNIHSNSLRSWLHLNILCNTNK